MTIGVCQVEVRASRKAVGSGNEDSTKVWEVKAKSSGLGSLEERVPSNPWGTGLRMVYYSMVGRRLHYFWWKYYITYIIKGMTFRLMDGKIIIFNINVGGTREMK